MNKVQLMCVRAPLGEVRFFSTRALISVLLLLFLFTALGSSFSSPTPLARSFFRAISLAADRLRAPGAGCGGGVLFSKKRMSSPSEKPRPSVGVWGASGLRLALGTSEAAFGDIRPSWDEEDDNPGLDPDELCRTLFWISTALCRRLCRNSCCFCFCCFSSCEAEMDSRGAPAASLDAEDEKTTKTAGGYTERFKINVFRIFVLGAQLSH